MVAGCPRPATSGNGMAIMVSVLGVPTPAAEMAGGMPAWVAYCMYQVPIMTIASLLDMNRLFASGYCWTTSAPGSMIPSLNSCFQTPRALTMVGLSHDISPLEHLVHTPGEKLSEISWRVSWLNATWPAPWAKQPWLCFLNTEQTWTHWASVVG